MSQVLDTLERLEVYNCPSCHCAVGDDWYFVGFSNHNLIACPQCNDYIEVSDD